MLHLLETYIPGFSTLSPTTWIIFGCICALICVLNIIAFWKVFEKAGEKGWKSLIPLYNIYIMFRISWSTKAFVNMMVVSLVSGIDELMIRSTPEGVWKIVLSIIAPLSLIYAYVLLIMMNVKLSRSFGHGVWFGLGLYFLNVPFVLILGFGKSKYTKPLPDPNFEKSTL